MASPNERKNYKNVFDVSSYHGIILSREPKKIDLSRTLLQNRLWNEQLPKKELEHSTKV